MHAGSRHGGRGLPDWTSGIYEGECDSVSNICLSNVSYHTLRMDKR